jgi:hypothetical protein
MKLLLRTISSEGNTAVTSDFIKPSLMICNIFVTNMPCGLGSSVSIAPDYGLDGPGIESRLGRDFSHTSRLARAWC